MYVNLSLGSFLIAATVLMQTFGFILLSRLMPIIIRWFRLHQHDFGKTIAMMVTVLGLFFLHTVEIWVWAVTFVAIGAINKFEDALYFSTTNFSTVGNSDVTLHSGWRLLGSLEGINGFMLVGWSIAYLVAASTRYGPFQFREHF